MFLLLQNTLLHHKSLESEENTISSLLQLPAGAKLILLVHNRHKLVLGCRCLSIAIVDNFTT